ncbi:MAG: OmpA family protein [Paucibacter sp.]|nr:OmpA family protein [Roseateles sp.]
MLTTTAALLLTACAQLPHERVILLPKPDGSGSGAVLVKKSAGGDGHLLLAEPYAQADATGSNLTLSRSDAATVQRDYGQLLAMQPPRPRIFVVQFASNSNRLTADTLPVLAEVRAALGRQEAGELVVIGHTDSVGTLEANDKLSLARAAGVRDLLIQQGVAAQAISIAGRGEREPLVASADERAEARNRRVEIKLR